MFPLTKDIHKLLFSLAPNRLISESPKAVSLAEDTTEEQIRNKVNSLQFPVDNSSI
jgi:hypothetical protein